MPFENPQLHAVVNQDGAVILNTERGLITTLNSTGAYIWKALERGEALETIISKISRETGEAAVTVDRDVHGFIKSLKVNHLLPMDIGGHVWPMHW